MKFSPDNPEYQSLRFRWGHWLKRYGRKKFFDAFMKLAQNTESSCIYCKQKIYLDIAEGCGVPDWRTKHGDYGCDKSPDTTEEATGSHFPVKDE